MIALACVAVAALLICVWSQRDMRASLRAELVEERRQHHNLTRELLDARSPDLEQLIALTDRLCQRIQAPELAVLEHQQAGPALTPPAVGFDDDEAFHAAHGLTTEQLADLAFAEEQT